MENILTSTTNTSDENLESRFAHIPGWGVDADPENDPTYPMKRYNGRDHERSHYHRPPQQQPTVEILKTIERKSLSATFGTPNPPKALSGAIRRFAFKYSEDSYGHWLPLMLADRVDMVEGVISDLAHARIPNIFAEKGLGAEWKYNRKNFIIKTAIQVAVVATVITLFSRKKKLSRG